MVNSLRLEESSSRITIDDLGRTRDEAPLVPLRAPARMPPSAADIAELRAAWAAGDGPLR